MLVLYISKSAEVFLSIFSYGISLIITREKAGAKKAFATPSNFCIYFYSL